MIYQNQVFSQNPPQVPGNIVAIPDTITCGASTSLSGTTTANNIFIRWWNASAGGLLLGTMASGGSFIFTPLTTMTYYAESFDVTTGLASVSRVGITVFVNSIAAPTLVMAYPTPIQCGSFTNLFTSSSSGIIK